MDWARLQKSAFIPLCKISHVLILFNIFYTWLIISQLLYSVRVSVYVACLMTSGLRRAGRGEATQSTGHGGGGQCDVHAGERQGASQDRGLSRAGKAGQYDLLGARHVTFGTTLCCGAITRCSTVYHTCT